MVIVAGILNQLGQGKKNPYGPIFRDVDIDREQAKDGLSEEG